LIQLRIVCPLSASSVHCPCIILLWNSDGRMYHASVHRWLSFGLAFLGQIITTLLKCSKSRVSSGAIPSLWFLRSRILYGLWVNSGCNKSGSVPPPCSSLGTSFVVVNSIKFPGKNHAGYQLIFVLQIICLMPSVISSMVIHCLARFVLVYYGSGHVLICWLRFAASLAHSIVHGGSKFQPSFSANWTRF
jgi:hypothetical protein